MVNPTTRNSTPPQSGRIGQQSPTSAVVPQAYTDTTFPGIAFTNQLAINLTLKSLAYYDASGAWQSVLGGPDLQSYYGPVAPSTGIQTGDRWFDTTTLMWNIWDGNLLSWMPGDMAWSVSPPDSPTVGQPWFNTGTRVLSYWNGTSWVLGTDPSAPDAYTGALPASATAGSSWIDDDGVAWTCDTAYSAGGADPSKWTRVALRVDPLAALIRNNGKVIVAKEATTAPTPATTATITTGLVWLNLTVGSPRIGLFYVYNGTKWKRVFAPNTVDLCLSLFSARTFLQFLDSDQAVCNVDGGGIVIPLTHIPIPGSEQVFYNSTPLKRGDWSRNDNALVVPGETWFRSGKAAWVDYAYYAVADTIAPALVGATSITGDHTSIAMPAGVQAGDILMLAISARTVAACNDYRFGAGVNGVWLGRADGSGSAVSITLDSSSADSSDGAAALMAIRGTPMIVSGEADTTSPGAPFTPSLPAGTFSFGLCGISAGSGLVSGGITDDTTGHWTTAARPHGSGSGKCSVYVGYAAGMPSGTWSTSGSTIFGGSRIVGLQ